MARPDQAEYVTRLDAYRRHNSLTYDQLALELGRHGVQCGRYCRGESQPSRGVSEKIRSLTHGVIHAGNYADLIDAAEAAAMMADIAARAAEAAA